MIKKMLCLAKVLQDENGDFSVELDRPEGDLSLTDAVAQIVARVVEKSAVDFGAETSAWLGALMAECLMEIQRRSFQLVVKRQTAKLSEVDKASFAQAFIATVAMETEVVSHLAKRQDTRNG